MKIKSYMNDKLAIGVCYLLFGVACVAMFTNNLPYMDDYSLIAMQRQIGYWAPTHSFQSMWGYYRLFYTTMLSPIYWCLGEHLWAARALGLLMHATSAWLLYVVGGNAGFSRPAKLLTFTLFLFFPYSLEAIAWPANLAQYPLAPLLALAGAALLPTSQRMPSLVLGSFLLGASFWVHEQIGPIAILLLIICVAVMPARRAPVAIGVLGLIFTNLVLMYVTRASNMRLSGDGAGTVGNIIAHAAYFAQLIRTTPLGDFYYETGGISWRMWWLIVCGLCGMVVFLAAMVRNVDMKRSGLAAHRYFLPFCLVMAVGAYVASLAPVIMPPLPWHTGRVIYIPFVAFAFAVGITAEMVLMSHSAMSAAVGLLAAAATVWGALSLKAESNAFDYQTRFNFARDIALRNLVGNEIRQGKISLVVGGFYYGDSPRPLFGEHFIGMTPYELRTMLGLQIVDPKPYPQLIAGANTLRLCKVGNLVKGTASTPAEQAILDRADKVIVAVWYGGRWVIQRDDTPAPDLQGYLHNIADC